MFISQSAQSVLMVRPTSFGYDEQTALTNVFQHLPQQAVETVRKQADTEFQNYVQCLRSHDIEVVVFEDQPVPPKPNAVYPNNWITTWPDGRIYLYPMATLSRRIERNSAILDQLAETFQVSTIQDLSATELQGTFLESTGAMIFDHPHKLVYACISPRCDEALFKAHAADLGYTPIAFRAYDQGAAMYHTNLIMSIQSTTAVICSQSISDPAERTQVLESLRSTGHQVIDISPQQVGQYCGNILEVRNRSAERFVVLSTSAYEAFTPAQRTQLEQDKTLLPVPLTTIQDIGGGGARCMVAELFLPHQN